MLSRLLVPLLACSPAALCLASGRTHVRRARVQQRQPRASIAVAADIEAPKLSVSEGCGKGGVCATEFIAPMEVIARIPRALVLQPAEVKSERALEQAGWASGLTAGALTALHSGDTPLKAWIQGWRTGGWASDTADLGPAGVRYGADDVTGSLIATGSDNDEQIYSVFKFPCHPAVYRASLGLASLTCSDEQAALAALVARGAAYRAMREELLTLVTSPSERTR